MTDYLVVVFKVACVIAFDGLIVIVVLVPLSDWWSAKVHTWFERLK
jgi:hypothetical protein